MNSFYKFGFDFDFDFDGRVVLNGILTFGCVVSFAIAIGLIPVIHINNGKNLIVEWLNWLVPVSGQVLNGIRLRARACQYCGIDFGAGVIFVIDF